VNTKGTAEAPAVETPMRAIPAALANRREVVTLWDGSTVLVETWSWPKFLELYKSVGKMEQVPLLAEMSVQPCDREKVKNATPLDLVKIAAASTRLNMTPELLKNLKALADLWGAPAEGLDPSSTPSK